MFWARRGDASAEGGAVVGAAQSRGKGQMWASSIE
jgi:hypothetical protein